MMSKESSKPRQRWSFKAKAEVVQRLLGGEPIEEVSREIAVPIHDLENWRRRAVAGMEENLKEHPTADPLERALADAQATIGRMTMELELHRGKGRRRTR
jgi:transposase-like protein